MGAAGGKFGLFFSGLLDDGEISRFDHPRVLANRKKPAYSFSLRYKTESELVDYVTARYGHSRQKTLGNPVCKRLPRNRPCVHVVSVFRNARPMSVQMEKNGEKW